MDVQHFKNRLLDLETSLVNRIGREHQDALAQNSQEPGDEGDASVADESEDEAFAVADANAAQLRQVRDALRRIDEGTFGRCVVDDKPIEPNRLEAEPWTPYCLDHAQRLERGSRPAPTL
jgi:DnaK suppressor protein